MKVIVKYFKVIKGAAEAFSHDNCVKLSAALSYYTVFSISPLLIIVISLSSLFFGREAIQGRVFWQLRNLLGDSAAAQIQEIIRASTNSGKGVIGTIIGIVILVLGATGIFTEIQDSINFIWSLKAKPKRGIVKYLTNRALSFSLVVSLGFLLMVSLVLSALLDVLSDRLTVYFPHTTVYVFYVINWIIIFLIISLLFTIIFKVLPDGKIKLKDAFIGASFTSLLFIIGKGGISYYLGRSNLGATYGAAASVIIILTWVYYTSIILYFGAEFTKVYALHYGHGITPNQTAVFIIKREAKEIETQPDDLTGKQHVPL